MIYIASPYSSPSVEVRIERFKLALNYTSLCMNKGMVVFSPIVYGHTISQLRGIPGDYLWWKDFNDRMMITSDAVHLLKIPGWKESQGIAYELEYAAIHGLRVFEVEYENL